MDMKEKLINDNNMKYNNNTNLKISEYISPEKS